MVYNNVCVMPVVQSTIRFWTIIPTLSVIVTIYILTLINITLHQVEQDTIHLNPNLNSVKKIVAFSLQKQLELDSEQLIDCGGKSTTRIPSRNNSSLLSRSVELNKTVNKRKDGISDSVWTNIINTNLFVYSVYLDRRLEPYYYLRVIGVVKGKWISKVNCQIFTTDGQFYVSTAIINDIWSMEWDKGSKHTYYNPVLISCRVPIGINTPFKAIITTKTCTADNENKQFKIIPKKITTRKIDFTICVKPLNFFEDISRKLIQWIEINRILGAGKIEFYVKTVRRNVWKILQWYNKYFEDEITIRKFTYIGENSRHLKKFNHLPQKTEQSKNISENYFKYHIWQKRRYELVTYNDCFYRNLETSNYVIPLDIDEIIVPKQTYTWQDLLNSTFHQMPAIQDKFASFTVQNAYYLRTFNNRGSTKKQPVFFLEDKTRSELSEQGESGKSFISTNSALTVFNHYALDVLRPGVRKCYFLSSQHVQMNHYKTSCLAVILPECVKYLSSPVRIVDTVIFKYKSIFMKNYERIIKQMDNSIFLP